jgi:hypothetical protein
MAENRANGPFIGMQCIYTQTAAVFYPALVVSVAQPSGLVRLTTFPPGGTTPDQQNVSYDGSGLVSNTWRFPDVGTGQ